MSFTNKLLDSLNKEQKEAVLNTEGPSLVAKYILATTCIRFDGIYL